MKKNRKQRKMLRDFYKYACPSAQMLKLRGGNECCNGSDNDGNPPPPPKPKTTTIAAGSQAMPENWGS